jgi:hypothetical protein
VKKQVSTGEAVGDTGRIFCFSFLDSPGLGEECFSGPRLVSSGATALRW